MLKLPNDVAEITADAPSRIQPDLLKKPFCRPKEVPDDYNPFRSVLGDRAEDAKESNSELEIANDAGEGNATEDSGSRDNKNNYLKRMILNLLVIILPIAPNSY